MAFAVLWSIDDLDDENEEPLFQLSQESTTDRHDTRTKIDYLGESLQCQLRVDRYFTTVSPAVQVYSSIDPHLLGVLQGSSCTSFVRLGPRPPQLPLGVLFGETMLWDGEGQHEIPRTTDGVAVRVIKKLFAEMQNEVRNGNDAFSVRMGFCCFIKHPTQPTDLLKNIKQQVPPDLEWGDVEGIMPGKYIYVTSVGDVLRTLSKLMATGTFKNVMHRLSYCMHFLILKTPAGMPPSAASTAKVAHLIFSDIHPDHTQAAQKALSPALTKLRKDKESFNPGSDRVMFNGVPLSPRGAPPSPVRGDTDDVLSRCFGLLKTMTSSRLVVLAAAKSSGPLTSREQVQMDTMINILQATQKAGPVEAKFRTNLNSIFAPHTTSESPPRFSPPGYDYGYEDKGDNLTNTPALPVIPVPAVEALDRHAPDVYRQASRREVHDAQLGTFERQIPSRPPSPFKAPVHSPPRPVNSELRDIASELDQVQRELSPPSPETQPEVAPHVMFTPSSRSAELVEVQRMGSSLSDLNGSIQKPHAAQTPRPQAASSTIQSELLLKGVRIHELENQVATLEAKLVQLSGEGGSWESRVEAETSRRDVEALKMELTAEKRKGAAESAALKERIVTLETAHVQKIHEMQALIMHNEGDDRELSNQKRELQNKIIECEQKRLRADQQKEDALMRSRALSAGSEDMKTQIAGLKASLLELEARWQNEAIARDAADKDVMRLNGHHQAMQEQMSALKKANADAELEVRVTRSELEAIRCEAGDLSMDLENQKALSRRLRLHLESMGGVERDRVEERETADRARIWADFIEGLHWLSHTCSRWSHLRGVGQGASNIMPLNRMEDINVLRERLSQRDAQLYAKTSEALALEQELVEIKGQFRDYQKEIERTSIMQDEKVRLLESETSELERQRGQHSVELKRATDLAQTNESERHESADMLRRLRSEHAAMKETVEEVTRQRSAAIQEAEHHRRKMAHIEAKSDKEMVRLSAELKQREIQLTDSRRQLAGLQQVAEAHQNCDRIQRSLEAKINEFDAKQKKAERQNDELELKVLEQSTMLKEEEENAKRADKLLGEQERYLQTVKSDRDRMEAERKSSQEWVKSVQEEIRGKTQTLDGIEKLLKDEQAKEVQREREIASLQEQLKQSRDEVLELQQKIIAEDERPSKQMSPVKPAERERSSSSVVMEDRAKLKEQLVSVERENARLKMQREEELARTRPPPMSSIPQPSIARAELQLQQMNNDLANMPHIPLPTPFPRTAASAPDLSVRASSLRSYSQPRQTLMSPHTVIHQPSPSPMQHTAASLMEQGRLHGTTPPRHNPSPQYLY
eukprot:TRINITY_DN4651_c2_g1_i1.p1 TRINITY_DN4651_c2_g1~~TRINITY_DN4651_c2_g1_i1.p1  ORF type:complete len:1324 (+),score=298.12 TRINITY_DN4651_c2_g1_i1:43-4014(+)